MPTVRQPQHGIIDCYVRNSTALQVDNWRADYQKEQLPQIVQRLGYTPQVWEEQGTSGESLEHRTQMQAILSRLRQGKTAGIACVSFDRLSRDIDLVDGLTIWQTVKDANGVIITPDRVWQPGRDDDDDMGFIQFWLAGRRKRQQLNDLYEGLVQKAANEPIFRGRVPYGYIRKPTEVVEGNRRKLRSTWVIDDEVAPVVRYIFQEFPRRSARWLAGELNRRGGTWRRKRWNADGTFAWVDWYTNDILRLVKSPIYCGVVQWGVNTKSRRVKQLLAARGADPTRPISHTRPELAIVDEGTWQAAQVKKEGDPRQVADGGMHPQTAGTDAIFAGILRCPKCNAVMYATQSRVVSLHANYVLPSYVCGQYHRGGSSLCSPHQVKEWELQKLVRERLAKLFTIIEPLTAVAAAVAQEETTDQRIILEQERDRLIDNKQRILTDRYVTATLSDQEFEQAMRLVNQRLADIQRDLDLAQPTSIPDEQSIRRLLAGLTTPEALDIVLPTPHRLEHGGFSVLTDEERLTWRQVVRTLIKEIALGYHSNGATRKADVWLERIEFVPYVQTLIDNINKGELPSVDPAELNPTATILSKIVAIASRLRRAA